MAFFQNAFKAFVKPDVEEPVVVEKKEPHKPHHDSEGRTYVRYGANTQDEKDQRGDALDPLFPEASVGESFQLFDFWVPKGRFLPGALARLRAMEAPIRCLQSGACDREGGIIMI